MGKIHTQITLNYYIVYTLISFVECRGLETMKKDCHVSCCLLDLMNRVCYTRLDSTHAVTALEESQVSSHDQDLVCQ